MICHSQRAIHTCNALIDYPDELRKRIHVVAIAPAAYIYEETCGSVIHYRAPWWRDLIPWFDQKGAIRERHNVIALDSHPQASLFDHEFMSPTYKEKISFHINEFMKKHGN